MELIFPTEKHKQAALDFRQEHFDNGETTISGDGGLDKARTYEEWLEKIEADVTRESDELVPATQYFGIKDGRIVGTLQIRHRLNEYLTKIGGHIGYGVRPTERRKGYATQMLSLALEKCRELGVRRALVTCNDDNIGSEKTILNNGGVYESEITEDDGTVVKRFWIAL